ncbi:S8 family peptidase [Anabaena aphanizomenioides LEGE 00250]|jgi:subtilisin family serine protease|uniref:S8 family peptidase n=1 Tax=Sphaerospermopsis aphanizomenoides LEGE 00250 TaxID=2777972 RepID=A0ABR9VD13_9CYAN|nr:S8/S53 family peptidase [Sphaerospermopsis aphanizomenoides]MBE9235607.1 S8 family peptidase [Sphaerospermopsis aphanizomenoides LEGE 00250]
MTILWANTSVYHSGWCEEYLMGVYIIRPKTTSVARSLKLASRKFTAESRPSQVAEVVNFWQQDPVYQEINSYLDPFYLDPFCGSGGVIREMISSSKDADTLMEYQNRISITGTKIVDIPDQEIDKVRQDLPNALILRDFPIGLIQPERNLTGKKDTINVDDLWHLEAISLITARQQGFTGTGKGITVAVLDSGIDANHPEIKDKIIESYRLNPRTQEIQTVPFEDTVGHGTHVAGLICGNQVGVAPEAQIINSIMFPNGVCNLSDWISWFNWLALQPEINIVNISAGELSLPAGYFELFNSLIDDLIAVGLLPICAVGNEGFNRSRTPGNCKGSLSVGAINNKNKVAYFSGNTTITITNDSQSYNVPYVVAPGESVYSSVLGGGYEAWNGTSMATPIVSGVAALVLEKYNKNISVLNLLDEILTNCKDLGLDKERQGKGLVQVPKALYEP